MNLKRDAKLEKIDSKKLEDEKPTATIPIPSENDKTLKPQDSQRPSE